MRCGRRTRPRALGRPEAQRILTDLLEETHELPDALVAAIAARQLEEGRAGCPNRRWVDGIQTIKPPERRSHQHPGQAHGPCEEDHRRPDGRQGTPPPGPTGRTQGRGEGGTRARPTARRSQGQGSQRPRTQDLSGTAPRRAQTPHSTRARHTADTHRRADPGAARRDPRRDLPARRRSLTRGSSIRRGTAGPSRTSATLVPLPLRPAVVHRDAIQQNARCAAGASSACTAPRSTSAKTC